MSDDTKKDSKGEGEQRERTPESDPMRYLHGDRIFKRREESSDDPTDHSQSGADDSKLSAEELLGEEASAVIAGVKARMGQTGDDGPVDLDAALDDLTADMNTDMPSSDAWEPTDPLDIYDGLDLGSADVPGLDVPMGEVQDDGISLEITGGSIMLGDDGEPAVPTEEEFETGAGQVVDGLEPVTKGSTLGGPNEFNDVTVRRPMSSDLKKQVSGLRGERPDNAVPVSVEEPEGVAPEASSAEFSEDDFGVAPEVIAAEPTDAVMKLPELELDMDTYGLPPRRPDYIPPPKDEREPVGGEIDPTVFPIVTLDGIDYYDTPGRLVPVDPAEDLGPAPAEPGAEFPFADEPTQIIPEAGPADAFEPGELDGNAVPPPVEETGEHEVASQEPTVDLGAIVDEDLNGARVVSEEHSEPEPAPEAKPKSDGGKRSYISPGLEATARVKRWLSKRSKRDEDARQEPEAGAAKPATEPEAGLPFTEPERASRVKVQERVAEPEPEAAAREIPVLPAEARVPPQRRRKTDFQDPAAQADHPTSGATDVPKDLDALVARLGDLGQAIQRGADRLQRTVVEQGGNVESFREAIRGLAKDFNAYYTNVEGIVSRVESAATTSQRIAQSAQQTAQEASQDANAIKTSVGLFKQLLEGDTLQKLAKKTAAETLDGAREQMQEDRDALVAQVRELLDNLGVNNDKVREAFGGALLEYFSNQETRTEFGKKVAESIREHLSDNINKAATDIGNSADRIAAASSSVEGAAANTQASSDEVKIAADEVKTAAGVIQQTATELVEKLEESGHGKVSRLKIALAAALGGILAFVGVKAADILDNDIPIVVDGGQCTDEQLESVREEGRNSGYALGRVAGISEGKAEGEKSCAMAGTGDPDLDTKLRSCTASLERENQAKEDALQRATEAEKRAEEARAASSGAVDLLDYARERYKTGLQEGLKSRGLKLSEHQKALLLSSVDEGIPANTLFAYVKDEKALASKTSEVYKTAARYDKGNAALGLLTDKIQAVRGKKVNYDPLKQDIDSKEEFGDEEAILKTVVRYELARRDNLSASGRVKLDVNLDELLGRDDLTVADVAAAYEKSFGNGIISAANAYAGKEYDNFDPAKPGTAAKAGTAAKVSAGAEENRSDSSSTKSNKKESEPKAKILGWSFE